MSTNKILLKFAKKGINLSPEAYERVVNAENPLNFASNLIVKLKSDKFSSKDLVSVSGETVDEILGVKPKTESSNQETLAADVKPALIEKPPAGSAVLTVQAANSLRSRCGRVRKRNSPADFDCCGY